LYHLLGFHFLHIMTVQKPEDLKKKKKKEKGDTGIVQLLDGKRAMNAGIALAKLKVRASGRIDLQ
jgi:hypothetical protein